MEVGILFTSHPDPETEPYPHQDVHARTTAEILEAEALGFASVGSQTLNSVGRYDGQSWSPLGTGMALLPTGPTFGPVEFPDVKAFAIHDEGSGPVLFAAGEFGFTDPDDTPANSLQATRRSSPATSGRSP